MYKPNPKTEGSGIYCVIPQEGECPQHCEDCFFQSGRSFLEPLAENLPNMVTPSLVQNNVIRVNDGNDSNNQMNVVLKATKDYPMKFYNTSMDVRLADFDAPVVLTINPADMTNTRFYKLVPPVAKNLMFVRIRTNTWNLKSVVDPAIEYYTKMEVPVVLTFMAYYKEKLPGLHADFYTWRERTLNSYWVLNVDKEREIMRKYEDNIYVYSCGKDGSFACSRCGNCLREYFATIERLRLDNIR